HNFVGGYCLLMLPLVVGFTLTQQGKWRWLGFGAIALNAITLYISGSRGALLGAVALCLVLIPLYIFCYPSKTRKHWIAVTLLCFLLLGICTSNPRVRALFTIAPSASTQLFSIDQLSDGPTKDRLFMLHSGLRILKQHPLLGVGPGNLSRVYNQYRPVDVGDGLELVQQLHNMPAQIMAETGLIGFGGYLLWLASLVKLAWAIQKRVNNRRDRILLYSISASWFAYTVSSLTDYQLENIGIATVLSLTTALLICLADQHLDSSTTHSLSSRARRLLSLGLLLYFSIALNMWTRADIGFYLSNAANKDIENVNLVDADAKLLKASELLPWDPTPAALASEHLIYLSEQTTDAKKRETLTSAAIDSLRAAVQAAPNDPWFNQNLAVLLLHEHPAQALPYSLHAVSLFPRGAHSSYYTLGKIYLKQHNPENAVTAFVLESLANPKFLVSPIWQSPSLSPYLSGVLEQTLTTWEDVLHATSPGSQQHRWLNQQIILIKWWYHQPFSSQTIDDSYTQLILGLDADRERSLAQLKQLAASVPPQQDSDKLTLLRAWLAPEDYFSDAVEGTSITPEEKQTVIDDIHTYTDIRTWLTSIQQPMSTSLRYGLAFAYRNHSASRIRQILHADGLSSSYLLDQLSLFSSPPREFSQLDRKIFQIFQTKLSSAHV
ncbi:MAG: O-antigen ligase family protein, partial [Cyanobacteria bacterium J06649_4]